MTSSSRNFIVEAEIAFAEEKFVESLKFHQKAITKIIEDEDVLGTFFPARPPEMPATVPSEALGMEFKNFCGLFRDSALNITQATQPEAFKFLESFRPGSSRTYPRFTSPRAKLLVKALQIAAAATLGILASNANDSETAAQMYRQALELGATEPSFTSPNPNAVGLELWIAGELRLIQDNLDSLKRSNSSGKIATQGRGVESLGANEQRASIRVPDD